MPLDGRVAGRAPVDAVHEQGGGVLSVPIGRRRSGARHAGRARAKDASPSTSGASAELAATGRRLPESKSPPPRPRTAPSATSRIFADRIVEQMA